MTYIAARAGYDFVSFRLIYMGLPGEANYDVARNPQMLRQTKTALAATGLKLLDIEVARISDGLDPKTYLPAMEAAAELGGKYVLASGWATDRQFAVDCFGQLCDLARPLGLTVVLEFVTFAAVQDAGRCARGRPRRRALEQRHPGRHAAFLAVPRGACGTGRAAARRSSRTCISATRRPRSRPRTRA